MSSLLEVEDFHISFQSLFKRFHVVRGVSFTLNTGEKVGIVGESGAGKSVLVKSLTRLPLSAHSNIERGKVLYKGQDLLKISESKLQKIRGKEIGMIFQDPMSSLNPTMKIGQQITEGYHLHHPKAKKKQVYQQAIELLTRVGIPQPQFRYHQYPHELSGGMRQRVMIVINMLLSPKILIADEPTTALDVTIQAQILALLKNMQTQEDMSIILITHDLGIVAGFCDRVLVMYAGKIVESAQTKTLYYSPKHPYTQRLLQSIPRLDAQTENTLYSIEGSPPDLSTHIPGCAFAPRCPHATKRCHHQAPPSIPCGERDSVKGHSVNCWLYHDSSQEEEEKNPPLQATQSGGHDDGKAPPC